MGGSSAFLHAQETAPQAAQHMVREGSTLKVSLDLDLDTVSVRSNRMVVYTPFVAGERDTVSLSSIGIMGRRRYFFYERNEKRYPEVFENENFRTKEKPAEFTWNESFPYDKWMDGSKLKLRKQVYGCCDNIIEESVTDFASYHDYHPVFQWITPEAELVKVRSLQGSAFIDFVVSTTDIRPDYRQNRRELGKILGTIDSLKADADITMDTIYIKGFASPESPYKNNTRLAKGRTQALKDYVTRQYSFNEDFILTSYEPEDWEGLRKFVEASSISHRQEILDIIDSDMDPDPKEWKLKSTYPHEYRYLLDACYPALRHSDYKIIYKIRTYTDIEDLRKVFREAPAKLSLREFCNLASSYEPGSEEFNDVYSVAVTVYPHSEAANLNAANAAMDDGDKKKAQKHLSKAGEGPEAVYARGVYAGLIQDYAQALELFTRAAQAASEAGNTTLADTAAGEAEKMRIYTGK